jgi:alkylation response protein AidB-like acyl-CoA dehydrogenase
MSDQATISLDDFVAEATSFLDANATLRQADKRFKWGEGDDDMGMFEEVDRDEEERQLAKAKQWRAKRYDAGFGWISGPADLGGRGLPAAHARAYDNLEAKYTVPAGGFFGIGLGMVAPTILTHATPDVKAKYLPKMYRGDIVGCQLFSEPGAGSDLAGLTMRAERDGDEWILNGQKVWTSGAHYSDIGEVIARTDWDMPKHRGLTGFVVDMKAPGVEVRPLRQMTGGAAFNEVFFTDVRVPDDHRLGDVNQGWTVALTTLMNERASIGAGSGSGSGLANGTRFIETIRHLGLTDDKVVRDAFAKLYIGYQVAKFSNQRALAKVKAGQAPGPEMSISKMVLCNNMRATVEFVSLVLGPKLVADTGEWGTYAWSQFVLSEPAMHIAGGSDETLRNIVGERVLGLPKEPGIDTTSPFRELRTN